MLIDTKTIINILKLNKITTTGIFHIGAHDCEEYNYTYIRTIHNVFNDCFAI